MCFVVLSFNTAVSYECSSPLNVRLQTRVRLLTKIVLLAAAYIDFNATMGFTYHSLVLTD